MDEDKEIQAMSQVNTALKALSEEERYRVMQWAANKYLQNSVPLKLAGPALASPPAGLIGDATDVDSDDDSVDDQPKNETRVYATFAEMLDASGADKDPGRFLIAAYWLQTIDGKETWKSFQINKLLKDTGNQIAKISNPIHSLSKSKPALVVQVSKNSTSTGQGAKTMKLTTEGIKKALQMLGEEK